MDSSGSILGAMIWILERKVPRDWARGWENKQSGPPGGTEPASVNENQQPINNNNLGENTAYRGDPEEQIDPHLRGGSPGDRGRLGGGAPSG
jgi:hypothetical protein